ncbi:MAG: hypothetical protein ACR2RL_23080, partial [Gammaproteobacteria bacterium]
RPDWAALVVGGREVERIALGAAEEVTTIRFEALRAPRAPTPAAVRIQGDDFDADDVRHAVLAPEPALSVLIIEDARLAGARSNEAKSAGSGLYLRRALALADSPPITVRGQSSGVLSAADLEGVHAIIVNDARLDESAHGVLARYVRDGGGVLVVAGGRAGGTWPRGVGSYLPGQMAGRVEAPRGAPLGIADPGGLAASEGLFAGFSLHGASLGRVWRYRRLVTGRDDRVWLRYADGGAALAERRSGLGRALVLTSTLDNRWNSLPVAPAFVPFLHRLLAELGGHEPPLRSFTTGSALDVDRWLRAQPDAASLRQALASGARLALRVPGGSRDTLDDATSVIRLERPGVYELDRADGTGLELMWAANALAAESELASIDANVVASALVRMAAADPTGLDNTQLSGKSEEGLELWRFALMLALALLLAETWLSNRGNVVRSQPVGAHG